jgi:hypothetical protein
MPYKGSTYKRRGYAVGRGKRRTQGYWSTDASEDPNWWRKRGGGGGVSKKSRSRFKGGRKSTTSFNQRVGRRTRRGDIVTRVVRAFKQWWR